MTDLYSDEAFEDDFSFTKRPIHTQAKKASSGDPIT
jgi:hypothetical protein